MNSKPCATCVEVTVVALICAIIGTCIYVSLHNVPTHNAPTQKTESQPTLKTASMSSSPMLVPVLIQTTTPKTRTLKLVTIVPEKN